MPSGVSRNKYDDHDDYISECVFPSYRRKAIKIAEQLGYGSEIRRKLEQTSRVAQVCQILNSARNAGA